MNGAKLLVFGVAVFLWSASAASAAISYSQTITLEPGWNIVSTPRILESHTFSLPETLENFSIFVLDASRPSGWATMSELEQTEFTPLHGYFIQNKSTTTQTLTFHYKEETTPNERLFSRTFSAPGWYSIGIANPSYAVGQGESATASNTVDILSSFSDHVDFVVDFGDANADEDSVSLVDPWKAVSSSDFDDLRALRETKGYAVYVADSGATYAGFQNEEIPACSDGLDNDSDSKIDYPLDFGCISSSDESEENSPSGTLLLKKSPTYTNQTVPVPQIAYKIAEYQLVTGGDDMFTFGAVGLQLIGSTTMIHSLTDVYLMVDASSTPVSPVGTSTIFWTGEGETIVANSTTTLGVYASLPESIAGNMLTTQLIFAGVSHNSGDIIATDIVGGQNIILASSTGTTTPPILDATGPLITGLTIAPVVIQAGYPITFSVTAEDPSGIGSAIYDIRYPSDPRYDGPFYLRPNCNFLGAKSGTCVFSESIDHASSPTILGDYVIESIRVADIQNNVSTYYPNGTMVMNGASSPHNFFIPQIQVISGTTTTEGSPTLSKYSAYANQTVTVPKTAYKVGEYRLQGGTSESVNLNTITLGFNFDEATNIAFFTDVYVTYGAKTSSVKGTVSTSSNAWSINDSLAAGQVLDVKVYASLSSSLASGVVASTTLLFDGTGVNSGNTVTTGTVTGQEITISTGFITAAVDASTPLSSLVVENSLVKIASFKFTTSNDSFTVTEATVASNGGEEDAATIGELIFKDGSTVIGHQSFSGVTATGTGLPFTITANATKVMDVYANVGSIGTDSGKSGANIGITLIGFKAEDSDGGNEQLYVNLPGNNIYAYKSRPIISNTALPNSGLTLGTKVLAKFTISSHPGGPIEWKKIVFNVSKDPAVTLATSSWAIYSSTDENIALITSSTSQSGNFDLNGTSGTFAFELATPEIINEDSSKTYLVKATVGGETGFDNSIDANIISSTNSIFVADYQTQNLGFSQFVWSDLSETSHNEASNDWFTDFLIDDLPTDKQTLMN